MFVIEFSPFDPPFPFHLFSLLLFSVPFQDSHSQLPAPENPKIRLYNTQQILSWEPVSLSNDTRPVVYWVQFK